MKTIRTTASFPNQKGYLFGIIFITVCAACAMAVRAYNPNASAAVGKNEAGITHPTAPASEALQSPLSDIDENTEVELVMLRPHGFEPAVITRKPGKFLLVVKNHSGVVEGVALSVRNSAAQSLQQANLPLQRMNWDSVLNLQPGAYTLTADNNPDWSCSIVISD